MGISRRVKALRSKLRAALRRVRRFAKKRAVKVRPIIKSVVDGVIEDAVGILKKRAFALIGRLATTGLTKAQKGRKLTRFITDTIKEEAAGAGEELKAKTRAGLEGLDSTDVGLVHLILYKAWKNSQK